MESSIPQILSAINFFTNLILIISVFVKYLNSPVYSKYLFFVLKMLLSCFVVTTQEHTVHLNL
jgi:hypothetical protein